MQLSLSTRDKLGMDPLSLIKWCLSTRDKLVCPLYTVDSLYKGQVGDGSYIVEPLYKGQVGDGPLPRASLQGTRVLDSFVPY